MAGVLLAIVALTVIFIWICALVASDSDDFMEDKEDEDERT